MVEDLTLRTIRLASNTRHKDRKGIVNLGMKIVMIGGGSYSWTPTLAGDLLLTASLSGSHLSLVDINRKAAEDMRQYCQMLSHKLNVDWTISVDELEAALTGADVVCVSISTGGLAAMHNDYTIPEQYGIFHTVGDTVGPGGISRTLRNVPIFVSIAQKMEQLCPRAWLIHVTNPLSQLTRAVAKTSTIRTVGLCHNYAGTIAMLADYFGAQYEDVDAISVGVNHYTWMKDITIKGRSANDSLSLQGYIDYFQGKNGVLITNTTDDIINQHLGHGKNMEYYLNFMLHEKLGYFPVGSSNHVAENLPFYCNDENTLKKYYIRRKGVLPRRQNLIDAKIEEITKVLNGQSPLPDLESSREGFSQICQSLYTGMPSRAIVTMPNQGQITNLPVNVAVETWASVSGNGIHPELSGDVPEVVSGSMLTVINEQELSVEAALTGNRNLVYQAMYVSPQIQNKEIVEQLADELIASNKEYLPQFD